MNTKDNLYMKIAEAYSLESHAVRAKVGACLVTPRGVVLGGYNGTPSGTENQCELQDYGQSYWEGDKWISVLVTKPEVIHAETNAVLKAAKEGVSTTGSSVYVTHAPCIRCAAMLINAGISRLVYKNEYKDKDGINLLVESGIQVTTLTR